MEINYIKNSACYIEKKKIIKTKFGVFYYKILYIMIYVIKLIILH